MSLTIILTLKDRSPFTLRWMQYMNDQRCPFPILIADGGCDREIEGRLRTPQQYPHLMYEYIRYPFDETLDHYFRKFVDVLCRVKTDFVLLADNDDFFLLERLRELVDFLSSHPTHVAARGYVVNLSVFGAEGQPQGAVRGRGYLAVSEGANSLEDPSPVSRVEALCAGMSANDYYMNWYAVTRSRDLQEVWRKLITLPVREVIVTEILTHVCLALRGQIAVLPFDYYVRQADTSLSGATLVAGNRFLEQCLLTGGLSEFRTAIDEFSGLEAVEDRERVMRAIAGWLEAFISNIHAQRVHVLPSRAVRLRATAKKATWLRGGLAWAYYALGAGRSGRRRRPVRVPAVEPYILA